MTYEAGDAAFLRHLGLSIRRLREARGWSQEDFADRCELHRTYVGSVERGESNVSALNLRRIARTLAVPVGELFPPEE